MTNPMNLDADVAAYYTANDDGTFQPTLHVQGAWVDHEQHMAPVGGLMIHAIEQHEPRDDLQLAKITFEILGQIPAEPTTVEVEVVRPGKTIQLLEATLSVRGRAVVKATAWRLLRVDSTPVAGTPWESMPGPDAFEPYDSTTKWPGGYIASLECRMDPASEPGRGRVWIRTDKPLVADAQVSPTAEFCKLIDTANGIATRVHPREWMFPNTDLTIHLFRSPRGPWVGFDTEVTFGPTGVGLTSTTLHDLDGPVGRSEQILTVRPLPPG
ncbi:thioesterase family protein [Mariniluteicoccus flavus]